MMVVHREYESVGKATDSDSVIINESLWSYFEATPFDREEHNGGKITYKKIYLKCY